MSTTTAKTSKARGRISSLRTALKRPGVISGRIGLTCKDVVSIPFFLRLAADLAQTLMIMFSLRRHVHPLDIRRRAGSRAQPALPPPSVGRTLDAHVTGP
jgi:hypothetical protein